MRPGGVSGQVAPRQQTPSQRQHQRDAGDAEGDRQLVGRQAEVPRQGNQGVAHGRIIDHDFAGNEAQQASAEPDHRGEALDHLEQKRTAEDDQRDRHRQADDQQGGIAFRRRRHRDHVVQAHDQVCDEDGAHSCHHAADFLAFTFAFILGQQEGDADVDQQDRTDQFEPGQLQQLRRDQRQGDPHHDRRT